MEEVAPEAAGSAAPTILSLGFNQDSSCFSIGTSQVRRERADAFARAGLRASGVRVMFSHFFLFSFFLVAVQGFVIFNADPLKERFRRSFGRGLGA